MIIIIMIEPETMLPGIMDIIFLTHVNLMQYYLPMAIMTHSHYGIYKKLKALGRMLKL